MPHYPFFISTLEASVCSFMPPSPAIPHPLSSQKVWRFLFWNVFVNPLEMKSIHISSLCSPVTVSCCFLNSSWCLCSANLVLCSQDEVHHRVVKGNNTSLMEIAFILCRLFAILFAFSWKVVAEKKGLKGSNYLPAIFLLLLTSLFWLCATYTDLFVTRSSQL